MKMKDNESDKSDITLKDKSVLSGKTIEEVKETSTNIYGQKDNSVRKNKKVKVPVKKMIYNFLNDGIKSENAGNCQTYAGHTC